MCLPLLAPENLKIPQNQKQKHQLLLSYISYEYIEQTAFFPFQISCVDLLLLTNRNDPPHLFSVPIFFSSLKHFLEKKILGRNSFLIISLSFRSSSLKKQKRPPPQLIFFFLLPFLLFLSLTASKEPWLE